MHNQLFKSSFSGAGFVLAAAMIASVAAGGSAVAGDDDLAFSFFATGVSQYRFRGLSLSDKDPAAQGSISVSKGGLSAGVWASSLAKSVVGADAEIDLYGSYSFDLGGGWSASVGGTAYLYAGGGSLDYWELNTSLSYANDDFGTSFGIAYVPDQKNAGDQDNVYLFNSMSYSVGNGFSLVSSLGFEDGGFGNNKWDWSLGTQYSAGLVTLSLSYVDSDVSGIGAGAIVGGIGFSF